VVPGDEVNSTVEAFHRRLAQQASPDAEPSVPEPLDLPDRIVAADGVAIHFVEGEGLSFGASWRGYSASLRWRRSRSKGRSTLPIGGSS
jgi:hypothetical protein